MRIGRITRNEREIAMTTYETKKQEARDEAVLYYSAKFQQQQLYMSELADIAAYFAKLGKRYGLLKEFRENGII